MVTSALLAGFSLLIKEHVAMAMVGEYQRVGLTLTIAKCRLKKNNMLFRILPTVRSLACLRCGFPIIGAPVCPCKGGKVVSVCSSLLICFRILNQVNLNLLRGL
jgi:hypothetical protein